MKRPLWIGEPEALALHGRLLALHGAPGLRDAGLLMSALGAAESPVVLEMAATYTAGIVRNYPFVDGNQRPGFVVGVFFLNSMAIRLEPSRKMLRKPYCNSPQVV